MTNLSEAIIRLHDIARKVDPAHGDELRKIADLISKVDYNLKREEYDQDSTFD